MTSTPNPTWYDILGVDHDATPEQIKAAWRGATDKFEPGSGTSQFRLFNEAADVLLDPARRADYDAELAGSDEVPGSPDSPDVADVADGPDEADVVDGAPDVPVEPVPEASAGEPPRALGWLGAHLQWVVLVCAPLLVAAVAATLIAAFGLNVGKADVQGVVPTVRTFDAGPDASAAAERALEVVLSYDYRHMEADRDRAVRFLTPAYRKDYLKTFDDLLTKGPDGSPGPVEKTQAVVTADVLDTGVVDAEADRVRVIAFVNQSSVKGDGQPTVFQNRVVATMVQRDGDWLVDKLVSY